MRRIALLSLLLAAMVSLSAGSAMGMAKSIRMPVDPAAVGLTEHRLVGEWVLTTQTGTVPATFGADGTVVIEFAPTAVGSDGVAFVSYAVGTWTPFGPRGGAFTAVQPISHANGVYLGTVTLDGYLTMSDDPALTGVVASISRVTIRDAHDNLISVAAGDEALAAMTATRSGTTATVGSTSDDDPEMLLGNGGRDCAWCGAGADGALVASGSPVEIEAAEARYIAAEDAARQPVTPSFGGGCGTCR